MVGMEMIHDYYCLECGTKHKGGEIAFDLAELLGIDRDDYSNLGYQSMTLVSSEKLKKMAHKCGSPLKHQKSSKISISLKDFLEIIESNVNEKDRQDSFFQGYMYDINKLENAFTQLFSYVNIRKKLEIRRIAESIINTFTRKDETLEGEVENEGYMASCYVKPEFFMKDNPRKYIL